MMERYWLNLLLNEISSLSERVEKANFFIARRISLLTVGMHPQEKEVLGNVFGTSTDSDRRMNQSG